MKSLLLSLFLLLVGSVKGPSLNVYPSPRIAMASVGFAYVTIHARIEGEMTEKWHCPKVTFLWPDDTQSSQESDCDPEEEGERHWSMTRGFPPGEWKVIVTLSKAGKTIAQGWTVVHVAG